MPFFLPPSSSPTHHAGPTQPPKTAHLATTRLLLQSTGRRALLRRPRRKGICLGAAKTHEKNRQLWLSRLALTPILQWEPTTPPFFAAAGRFAPKRRTIPTNHGRTRKHWRWRHRHRIWGFEQREERQCGIAHVQREPREEGEGREENEPIAFEKRYISKKPLPAVHGV